MDLNLRQLKTFLCIVRLGSFAAAAEHLCATQSAISVRIHELEEALGVKLFVRSHAQVQPTPKGRALIPFAEQLLGLASQVQQDIGDISSAAGTIRIGVCEPVASTWLATMVAAVRSRFPKVSVEIDKDLTPSLVRKLNRGAIDLALVAGPASEVSFTALSLGCIEFRWVASPRLPMPRGKLSPKVMRTLPLISLSQQPHAYPAIERWLKGGIEHQYVITCNDLGVVIRLLKAGVGVSLLAEVCCRDAIEHGQLRILQASPEVPPVEFFAIWRRTHHQPLLASIGAMAVEASDFRPLKAGRVAPARRRKGSPAPSAS